MCYLCKSDLLVEIGAVIKILQRSSVTEWTHSFFTDSHGVYNVVGKDLNVVVKQFDIAVKDADRSTDIFVLLMNYSQLKQRVSESNLSCNHLF